MAGVVLEAGEWLYKIFITLILATVTIAIVGSTVNVELNTQKIQEQLMLSRILYSPDGFWHMEDGVLHPGVVDRARFKDEAHMEQAFQYKDNYGGAKLTLSSARGHDVAYINKPTFDNFDTQIRQGLGGDVRIYTYPVVVRDENGVTNGKLTIQIAMPSIT
jgi:hypothetical protein